MSSNKFDYNITNIENNVMYFPLWRIRVAERFQKWSWESRYMHLMDTRLEKYWTHNCPKIGKTYIDNSYKQCPYCKANRLSEPENDTILNYMDNEYE